MDKMHFIDLHQKIYNVILVNYGISYSIMEKFFSSIHTSKILDLYELFLSFSKFEKKQFLKAIIWYNMVISKIQ